MEAAGVAEAGIEKNLINVVKACLLFVERVEVDFQEACERFSQERRRTTQHPIFISLYVQFEQNLPFEVDDFFVEKTIESLHSDSLVSLMPRLRIDRVRQFRRRQERGVRRKVEVFVYLHPSWLAAQGKIESSDLRASYSLCPALEFAVGAAQGFE